MLVLRVFPVGAMPTPWESQIMSSWAVSRRPSSTSCPYLPFRISLIPHTLGPMTSRST